jgi:hypothetical protein
MLGLGFARQRAGEIESYDENDDAGGAPVARKDSEGLSEEVNTVLLGLVPWGVSFLFHAGMVLLAIFVVWSTAVKVEEKEEIIPIARLSATPGMPKLQKTTSTSTSLQKTARKITTKQSVKTVSNVPSKDTSQTLIGASSPTGAPMQASSSSGSPFGGFYGTGTGGNATKLAYVIDASGSLVDSLPFVIAELKRSVSQLSDKQTFTVIFFQGEDAIEVPPKGPKPATSEMKQKVIEWIDLDIGHIIPMGQSNPIKALKLALSYEPQLMFLLSDNITGYGKYEVFQKRLLGEIDKANLGDTKINTIQFLYPDPLGDVGLTPTMELIAEKTKGVYKFVDARELGIE